jgi:hypothetical protein
MNKDNEQIAYKSSFSKLIFFWEISKNIWAITKSNLF